MARDPEFWFPANQPPVGRVGRPKVIVVRRLEDYPPPTPQPTVCRIWQGAVDQDGYGMLAGNHLSRAKRSAHRWVWEAVHGPIPPGMVVRHKCDNRPCYRLAHLELGTVADNNRDAQERGHLGQARSMSPSMIVAIWDRHEAGESYRQIHADYPGWSLATIKRVKEYIDEARAVVRPDAVSDSDAEITPH